jgi:hypothetical protein
VGEGWLGPCHTKFDKNKARVLSERTYRHLPAHHLGLNYRGVTVTASTLPETRGPIKNQVMGLESYVSGFGSLELKKQGEFGLVCPYTAVFCPPRRDRTKRSQCRETVPPRAREREKERERERERGGGGNGG